MKTKQKLEKVLVETECKYRNIIFGNDTPTCKECLNKLKRQYIIAERVYNQMLMENTIRKLLWDSICKNIVVDDNIMIDKGIGKLCHEVDFTIIKINSRSILCL